MNSLYNPLLLHIRCAITLACRAEVEAGVCTHRGSVHPHQRCTPLGNISFLLCCKSFCLTNINASIWRDSEMMVNCSTAPKGVIVSVLCSWASRQCPRCDWLLSSYQSTWHTWSVQGLELASLRFPADWVNAAQRCVCASTQRHNKNIQVPNRIAAGSNTYPT